MEIEHLQDIRGQIKKVKYKNSVFNVLYTKEGAMRSGDYHSSKQFDLILRGQFEVWLLKEGKTIKEIKKENELIVIPENIPHLFIARTDGVMLEWWERPFEAKYYTPYRKLVEENIRNLLNKND